jgi:hypothetical protein
MFLEKIFFLFFFFISNYYFFNIFNGLILKKNLKNLKKYFNIL